MSTPPPSERAPLVYTQEDGFELRVGEPVDLTPASRIVVGKADGICAEALRRACAEAFPGTRAEIHRSGGAVLAALRERAADFLLLGLTFDDVDGLDVLEANARELLARRVFVVSTRKDEQALRTLRLARFDGFLDPTEEDGAALVRALRQVADGRGYASPVFGRRLVERRSGSVLTQRLTPAELTVFAAIGDGTDDDAGAERLGLSRATLQSYRRNLLRKLDVTTSAKLVREAVRLGVVRLLPDGAVVRPGFARMMEEWEARRKSRADEAK